RARSSGGCLHAHASTAARFWLFRALRAARAGAGEGSGWARRQRPGGCLPAHAAAAARFGLLEDDRVLMTASGEHRRRRGQEPPHATTAPNRDRGRRLGLTFCSTMLNSVRRFSALPVAFEFEAIGRVSP